ncbi:snRNA-activating protein complex subunit 4 isoform X2 [Cylas formicarius]|uniref:snRNA-activating protein complex subunit 4 isoform X2 n=1 Tax=Cylas formicarius TaxID=197179 RepID=UPI002958C1A2|nr:snRNA-activating protein complex subunit 4 isoform X2 [Cylas formicarius]
MFKGEIEDIEKLDAAIRQHESDSFINYEEVSDNDEDDQDFDTCADISALKDYVPSALLTDDEKQLIDSCRDPDLKLLLELNRSKNVKLMQLYTKIRHLLMECQSNIVAKSRQIDSCSDQFKRVINRIWRFGYPYFKSTDNYPCPMNEYVARKEENRELPFYDMVPTNKWNRRDINRLKRGVTFCFKAGRDMETKKKITQLEEDILGERRTDKIAELKGLVAKLNETINSDDQELPTESSDRLMDWARLSATFLRSKYSSQECRSFWYLYQDPRINKTPWSLDERKKLDKLVRKYKHQNWERIASDLGTSRSALITCTHYFTGNTLRPGKFTPEEDAFLVEMVENHSVGDYVPWAKIAHFFKNHTRKQIFYRWRYYLNGRGKITKGPFTDAEDVLLMVLVDRFGTSFAKCQKYFPTRSMSQLKARLLHRRGRREAARVRREARFRPLGGAVVGNEPIAQSATSQASTDGSVPRGQSGGGDKGRSSQNRAFPRQQLPVFAMGGRPVSGRRRPDARRNPRDDRGYGSGLQGGGDSVGNWSRGRRQDDCRVFPRFGGGERRPSARRVASRRSRPDTARRASRRTRGLRFRRPSRRHRRRLATAPVRRPASGRREAGDSRGRPPRLPLADAADGGVIDRLSRSRGRRVVPASDVVRRGASRPPPGRNQSGFSGGTRPVLPTVPVDVQADRGGRRSPAFELACRAVKDVLGRPGRPGEEDVREKASGRVGGGRKTSKDRTERRAAPRRRTETKDTRRDRRLRENGGGVG